MVRPVDSSIPFTSNPAEVAQQVAAEVRDFKPLTEQAWVAASKFTAVVTEGASGGRGRATAAKEGWDGVDAAKATESDVTDRLSMLARLEDQGQVGPSVESTIAQSAREFLAKVHSEDAAVDEVRGPRFNAPPYSPEVADGAQVLWENRRSVAAMAEYASHAAEAKELMMGTHDQFESELTALIGVNPHNDSTNLISGEFYKDGKLNSDLGKVLRTVSTDGKHPTSDTSAATSYRSDKQTFEQLEKKLHDHLDGAAALEQLGIAPNHTEVDWARGEFRRIDDEISAANDGISTVITSWNDEIPFLGDPYDAWKR